MFSAPGQAFLETLVLVLNKPANQEVVSLTLEILRDYFAALRPEGDPDQPLDALVAEAEARCAAEGDPEVRALLAAVPDLLPQLRAALVLSGMGYGVLRSVLGGTTAIGSLMRRKLEPVLSGALGQIRTLQGRG